MSAVQDLTFSKELSPFVYIFNGLMLFLSQTFYAIDGKHARNTQRSSSLGQLMDHGCDAMNNFLYCILIAQSHLFGNSNKAILLQIGIQIPFYAFTLEEHFTETLRIQIYNIGVTEYQFFGILVIIIPAFIGHILSTFSILGYELIGLLLYGALVSGVIETGYLIYNSISGIKDLLHKWTYILIMFAFAIAEYFSYNLFIYKTAPLIIILLNGFFYALCTSI